MNERDYLAERFEEHRTHLRAVAYRMLGSLSEVDDAVQDAWLRLSRAEAAGIENLGGWLTTVVARVCLDMLRWRQSRREEAFSPDAPECVPFIHHARNSLIGLEVLTMNGSTMRTRGERELTLYLRNDLGVSPIASAR
jgi:RNA polymerase sigma-70 factor (ECF subfamily)